MPGVTPINGIRTTLLSDSPVNILTTTQNMADDLDTRLLPRYATTALRDAAIPSPVEGMAAYVTSTSAGAQNGCMSVYDGAVWRPHYHDISVWKTADESVASSTTFQNDDHLILPLKANRRYSIKFSLYYGATAAADLTTRPFTSTAMDVAWFQMGLNYVGGSLLATSGNIDLALNGAAPGFLWFDGDPAGPTTLHVGLLLMDVLVGAAGGNLTLQWAQLASSGVATILKAGSMAEARRIG